MKNAKYLSVWLLLFLVCFLVAGCAQTIRSGLDAVILNPVGAFNSEIPINQNPVLSEGEKSILRSLSPLTVCVVDFADNREVKQRRVGSQLFTNMDFTTSKGHYLIAENQATVDSLVTMAIANELRRINYSVLQDSAEQAGCVFVFSGKVKQFWVAPMKLVKGHQMEGYDYQASVQVEIWVKRTKDGEMLGGRVYSGYKAANYDGWPSPKAMGLLLDEALLRMLGAFTNDEELIKMLSEKS